MKLSLGLLVATAIAAVNGYSTTSTTICATASGRPSVSPVPTRSTTVRKTTTTTVFVTTHPTTTSTIPGTTDTITNTVTTDSTTTLSTSTDTISTTVYNTTTTTIEAPPVTSTVTETSSATATSTIGPFFTGVQDTLPGADPYTGTGSNNGKREAAAEPRRNVLLARAKPKFPTSVVCSKLVTIETSTVKTTTGSTVTTTTTEPPITTTSTLTITNTVTDAPSASTTVTISSTVTESSTETSTATATSTSTTTITSTVQASPTVVCNSSNYASSVNGDTIINATPETNNEDFYGVSANTVNACCAACAANPSCGAFSFLTANGNCQNALIGNGDTCSVNGDQFQALLSSGSRTTPLVVGNGLCGEFSSSET